MKKHGNRYIPIRIQNIYEPNRKRDKFEQEKLLRTYDIVFKRFSRNLDINYKYHPVNYRRFGELVESIVYKAKTQDDKGTIRSLYEVLRGNYPNLACEVRNRI